MENKTPKKKILNLFDIIVIVVVIVIAAAVLIYGYTSSRAVLDDVENAEESAVVEYTIEICEMPESAANSVKVGDTIMDSIKNFEMGQVQSVEVSPSVKSTPDYQNGKYVESELPESYTVTVALKSACQESDSSIVVGGGYTVAGGKSINVKGPGYAGSGYILQIERSDAE